MQKRGIAKTTLVIFILLLVALGFVLVPMLTQTRGLFQGIFNTLGIDIGQCKEPAKPAIDYQNDIYKLHELQKMHH